MNTNLISIAFVLFLCACQAPTRHESQAEPMHFTSEPVSKLFTDASSSTGNAYLRAEEELLKYQNIHGTVRIHRNDSDPIVRLLADFLEGATDANKDKYAKYFEWLVQHKPAERFANPNVAYHGIANALWRMEKHNLRQFLSLRLVKNTIEDRQVAIQVMGYLKQCGSLETVAILIRYSIEMEGQIQQFLDANEDLKLFLQLREANAKPPDTVLSKVDASHSYAHYQSLRSCRNYAIEIAKSINAEEFALRVDMEIARAQLKRTPVPKELLDNQVSITK